MRSGTFEEMMSRFKQTSDEKMSDLKRTYGIEARGLLPPWRFAEITRDFSRFVEKKTAQSGVGLPLRFFMHGKSRKLPNNSRWRVGPVFFTNAVIHTMAGVTLQNGYMRIEGAKIMEVGSMPA